MDQFQLCSSAETMNEQTQRWSPPKDQDLTLPNLGPSSVLSARKKEVTTQQMGFLLKVSEPFWLQSRPAAAPHPEETNETPGRSQDTVPANVDAGQSSSREQHVDINQESPQIVVTHSIFSLLFLIVSFCDIFIIFSCLIGFWHMKTP